MLRFGFSKMSGLSACNNKHLSCFLNVKSYHNSCAKITNLNFKRPLHINTQNQSNWFYFFFYIEKIDITGSGDNTLIVNLNDVLDASTNTNILKVLGNSGDSVNALGFAKISGVETEGSITYDEYSDIAGINGNGVVTCTCIEDIHTAVTY
jgi:hypothetical protein